MVMIKTFPNIHKFAWKSTKEASWGTTVATAGSGRVRTLTNRKYPKWTITTQFKTLTDDEAKQVFGFVNSVKGAYEPFFFLDPEDNKEEKTALPSLGVGEYQFVMKMGNFVQPVYKVENVHMFIDGVEIPASNYSVSGGAVQFKSAPKGVVTASYNYYWKVMLTNDNFKITAIFHDINQSDNLVLETVE